MKPGIKLVSGRIAYFLEGKGKDISFNRWRVTAYYEPYLAETLFFDSEGEYTAFMEVNRDSVFSDYEEYKQKRGD